MFLRFDLTEDAQEQFRCLWIEVKRLAKIRHVVAHWSLTHWSSEGTGAAVFTKVAESSGLLFAEDKVFSLEELVQTGLEISEAGKETQRLAFLSTFS